MKKDLFAYLPSEIITDILSKLPVQTIIICKLVRKSWRALFETREFVESHLRNATPALAVIDVKSNLNKIIEFEEEQDLDQSKLRYSAISKFSLPCKYGWIGGSVNGLLFLYNFGKPFVFCICNPITRDYIELDCTKECVYPYDNVKVIYGFGASKISGQHKVVLIFQDYFSISYKCVCHVYTMETNSWRRIAHVSRLEDQTIAVFLNGNLHWLVSDGKDSEQQISCFDLETELFSSFSSPLTGSSTDSVGLSALDGCLCLCDNKHIYGISLWLMKEYGDEKSWTKDFFICRNYHHFQYPAMYPIKIFKNGDILMAWGHMVLFYYSKVERLLKLIQSEPPTHLDAFVHTPNFLSLKSFELEDVRSF